MRDFGAEWNQLATRIAILGVPVDALTAEQALERIQSMLREQRGHAVFTPNPEMIVEASRNPQFLAALNWGDLNVADGAGLLWAAKRMGTPLPGRATGTDLVPQICGMLAANPVFFLGAAPGVAEETAKILKKMNPELSVAGTFAGSPAASNDDDIVRRINLSGARTVFVAYGAPAQELWIKRNLASMPSVRLAMGVGGAFDFITGKQKRAPAWMRSAGLEWLWRLVNQPTRFKRIVNAVVVFPSLILRHRDV